jgi:hypothetical protein
LGLASRKVLGNIAIVDGFDHKGSRPSSSSLDSHKSNFVDNVVVVKMMREEAKQVVDQGSMVSHGHLNHCDLFLNQNQLDVNSFLLSEGSGERRKVKKKGQGSDGEE